MVRRLSFVLALLFVVVLLFWALLFGVSSSERGYARAVLPVEARTLPEPPGPQSPDMGQL